MDFFICFHIRLDGEETTFEIKKIIIINPSCICLALNKCEKTVFL